MRFAALCFWTMFIPLTAAPQAARSYDIDCAIILCMAGGFPSSAECAHAYRTMIRRVTPWPILPPVGICTYASPPLNGSGPDGQLELDTSSPEFEWLNQIRIIWFEGRSYAPDGDQRRWDWSLRSCDREHRTCSYISSVLGAYSSWPASFVSHSGQNIPLPDDTGAYTYNNRAVLVEFGDFQGNVAHSDWISY